LTSVLLGVSPIGLGHATRGVALAQELERSGIDVEVATGGSAADLVSSYGIKVHDVISEPVPSVSGGEMKNASLWYLRYWLGYRRSKTAMKDLIQALQPDVVVGDEEFSGVSVALETGRRHALITDELELGFARTAVASYLEGRIGKWYEGLLERVSALIIPDFGQDAGNRHYVSPIVRRVTASRKQVLEENSLPADGLMILFSMSGAGVGGELLGETAKAFEEASLPGTFLVVAGNRGKKARGPGIYDIGPVRDGQNLIAAADLVVSTAGKSTIDEAASAGTPLIAIPIRNHPEQERNARELGYVADDAGRIRELIAERIGHRDEPRSFDGAVRAARLVASMAP
jgi:UDP-N-acetylglucosamine--N-acetylmuramyl-(pentapeptide) pyrophosphoryl-undecaprenol N-acetylglucosamine transferase